MLLFLRFRVTTSQACADGHEAGTKQQQRCRFGSRRRGGRHIIRRRSGPRRYRFVAVLAAVNKGERHRSQEQERPFRNATNRHRRDEAAIANRAFDFSFLDDLDPDVLRVLGRRHTGKKFVELWRRSGWTIVFWSVCRSRRFLSGHRILRQELEFGGASGASQRLDHLIDRYWSSLHGSGGKENAD